MPSLHAKGREGHVDHLGTLNHSRSLLFLWEFSSSLLTTLPPYTDNSEQQYYAYHEMLRSNSDNIKGFMPLKVFIFTFVLAKHCWPKI